MNSIAILVMINQNTEEETMLLASTVDEKDRLQLLGEQIQLNRNINAEFRIRYVQTTFSL